MLGFGGFPGMGFGGFPGMGFGGFPGMGLGGLGMGWGAPYWYSYYRRFGCGCRRFWW